MEVVLFMREKLKNPMFRNLVSTVVFVVIFMIAYFILKGSVDIAVILWSAALYFVLMTVFNIVIPMVMRAVRRHKAER